MILLFIYQLYSSSILLTNGDVASGFGDVLSVVVWDWFDELSSGRVRLTPDIIQRINLCERISFVLIIV